MGYCVVVVVAVAVVVAAVVAAATVVGDSGLRLVAGDLRRWLTLPTFPFPTQRSLRGGPGSVRMARPSNSIRKPRKYVYKKKQKPRRRKKKKKVEKSAKGSLAL